jgi:hypothetical protein
MPKLIDLRADPYEQADTTCNIQWKWWLEHPWSGS